MKPEDKLWEILKIDPKNFGIDSLKISNITPGRFPDGTPGKTATPTCGKTPEGIPEVSNLWLEGTDCC